MDRWKSRGRKSQRREEKRNEEKRRDETRGEERRAEHMSRVPIGLVLSPGGLVLGLVFIPHILTQTQAAFDQFGSAVYPI